ncbi:MAG: alpha/beta fold hydrolase [Gammaproteobacteria bacterium]|nr:alpha/beta fold hydrolase [Gammaproteobacteria bacterium]
MNAFFRYLTTLIYLGACFMFYTCAQAQQIDFQRCQIKVGAVERDAECGTLKRPEKPDQPNGRQIDLFVAKFPSSSPDPEADAFTLIQGGPGGSSIDLAISYYAILAPILAKRDVLVVDQRGTGRSNKLACPVSEDDEDLVTFDPIRAAEATQDCMIALQDSDLRYYTTSIAVQDLDAVRAASGYEQLTVYGASYGTRVAQHYLRRFPDSSRAVILDGVAHVGLSFSGGETARRSQDALDGIIDRCATDKTCSGRFGDLKTKFEVVGDRLREAPEEVTLAHPTSGRLVSKVITEQHFFGVIRMMSYSTEQLAILPLLISDTHDGHYQPLAAQMLMIVESLGDSIATGMQNTVMCTEDHPFSEPSDNQKVSDTYLGSLMIDAINVTCEVWPRGPVDEDFREPIVSDVPVLILSGEADPITPPVNGELAAKMLSNAKHIVVPAHGHGVIGRGCVPALVSEFIQSADLNELNTQCVERERAAAFFEDSTGPRP